MASAAPAVSRSVTTSNSPPSPEAPRSASPAPRDGRGRDTAAETVPERAIDALEPKWADAADAATD